MPDERRMRSYWLLALLGTALFFLLVVRKLLMLKCIFLEDAWDALWPWFAYLADSLGAGRFPLWDPHSSCGFPFYANPQAGTFYPVYVAAGWLFGGSFRVFQYLWLGHWLFGILGMFFLGKRLGLSPLGTFIGAITFGFSGFFIGNAQHTAFLNTACYIPWVLLVVDIAQEGGLRHAMLGGVLFGMAGLAGYPGMAVYLSIMLVVWCLLKYGTGRRSLATLALALVVGCIVVAPAYLSFFVEAASITNRTGPLDVEVACRSERFPLSAMVSLIAPQFPLNFRELIDCDRSMADGYLGVFGLMSVLAVIFSPRLRKSWSWLLVWMLVAWLFSLGSEGGLRIIGYYLFPPLRYVRHSALFRVFWILGASVLAGVLIDRLQSRNAGEQATLTSRCLVILAVLLGMCGCVFLWVLLVPKANGPFLVSWIVSTQAAIILAYLTVFGLYKAGHLRPLLFLAAVCMLAGGDLAAHFYGNRTLVCAEVEEAPPVLQVADMAQAQAGVPFTGREKRLDAPQYHPNQGLFDRKFYIRSYNSAISPDYDFLVGGSVGGAASHPVLTEFLGVLEQSPRFWLTPRAAFADEQDKNALTLLRNTGPAAGVPVFIHARVPYVSERLEQPVVPGSFGKVEVLEYRPEEIVLRADAPEDAWLFCLERYSPSWRASVDGSPEPIRRADFCFRAVRVPQGSHRVEMTFAPWIYRPLWFASWSLSLLVVVACLVRRRHRQ
ncbi:MAG: hypothetical protein HY914_04950 [Desulfomonile tiedjei]|nr:hypothetical protein [Desulfomonile tiedjei]